MQDDHFFWFEKKKRDKSCPLNKLVSHLHHRWKNKHKIWSNIFENWLAYGLIAVWVTVVSVCPINSQSIAFHKTNDILDVDGFFWKFFFWDFLHTCIQFVHDNRCATVASFFLPLTFVYMWVCWRKLACQQGGYETNYSKAYRCPCLRKSLNTALFFYHNRVDGNRFLFLAIFK